MGWKDLFDASLFWSGIALAVVFTFFVVLFRTVDGG